jgi:hypothetical protein
MLQPKSFCFTILFPRLYFGTHSDFGQGCQMVYFQTKNPTLGKFWRVLQRYILWPFGRFYDHLVHFVAIRYILWSFGTFSPLLVCCTKKNLATLTLATLICFHNAGDQSTRSNVTFLQRCKIAKQHSPTSFLPPRQDESPV